MFTWSYGFCRHKYQKKTRTNCTSTFVPESLLSASFCPCVNVIFRSEVHSERHFCEHYRGGLQIRGFSVIQQSTTQFAEGSSSNLLCYPGISPWDMDGFWHAEQQRMPDHVTQPWEEALLQARKGSRGAAGSAELEKRIVLPASNWKQCKEQPCWMKWWHCHVVTFQTTLSFSILISFPVSVSWSHGDDGWRMCLSLLLG